jgi:iron complex outermembrane receptor protein
LRSSVAGFYNEIDDLITVPPGAFATNLKGADAQGLELQLEGLWEKTGLGGQASYTFQETEDRQTRQWLTDSPKHLVKFNLSLPVVERKVFASAGAYAAVVSNAAGMVMVTAMLGPTQ